MASPSMNEIMAASLRRYASADHSAGTQIHYWKPTIVHDLLEALVLEEYDDIANYAGDFLEEPAKREREFNPASVVELEVRIWQVMASFWFREIDGLREKVEGALKQWTIAEPDLERFYLMSPFPYTQTELQAIAKAVANSRVTEQDLDDVAKHIAVPFVRNEGYVEGGAPIRIIEDEDENDAVEV